MRIKVNRNNLWTRIFIDQLAELGVQHACISPGSRSTPLTYILSKNKNWLKVRTSFDNYIGYIKATDYTNNYKPTHKIFILKSSIFNKQSEKTKYFLPFASIRIETPKCV